MLCPSSIHYAHHFSTPGDHQYTSPLTASDYDTNTTRYVGWHEPEPQLGKISNNNWTSSWFAISLRHVTEKNKGTREVKPNTWKEMKFVRHTYNADQGGTTNGIYQKYSNTWPNFKREKKIPKVTTKVQNTISQEFIIQTIWYGSICPQSKMRTVIDKITTVTVKNLRNANSFFPSWDQNLCHSHANLAINTWPPLYVLVRYRCRWRDSIPLTIDSHAIKQAWHRAVGCLPEHSTDLIQSVTKLTIPFSVGVLNIF